MRSTIQLFGLTPNQLVAEADFRATRDEQGAWSGSQSFFCRQGDFSEIEPRIKAGNAYSLNTMLKPFWVFLLVKSYESQDEPGGITRVNVQYTGVLPESTSSFDSGVTTYQLSGAIAEKDIINHPKVQKLDDITAITALFTGKGVIKKYASGAGAGDLQVVNASDTEDEIGKIYSMTWYEKIFVKGERTYLAPTLEWTKSGTIKGRLSKQQSKVEKLGYIDTPDGRPVTPAGRNWLLVGVDEGRTIGATEDSASSYSYRWMLSDPGKEWDADIYTPDE